jgi:hypothetical protein
MKLIVKICLFALVFASCTKSSNNGGGVGGGGNNGTTINYSDYYAEITFNGNTYKTVGSASTGVLVTAATTITLPSTFDTVNLIGIKVESALPNGILDGTFFGDLGFYKPLGGLTTGIYKSVFCKWKNGQSLGAPSAFVFKDPQSAMSSILTKDSSLSVNVTNISSKSIEGTFNCILQNNSGEFPATGKFKAYRF